MKRRGNCHEKYGRLKEAMTDYKEALTLDPANKDIKEDVESCERSIKIFSEIEKEVDEQ